MVLMGSCCCRHRHSWGRWNGHCVLCKVPRWVKMEMIFSRCIWSRSGFASEEEERGTKNSDLKKFNEKS